MDVRTAWCGALLRWCQQAGAGFSESESFHCNRFVPGLFAADQFERAHRYSETAREVFQKSGVGFSIHRRRGHFYLDGIAIFTGDFVAPGVWHDPKTQARLRRRTFRMRAA